MRSFTTIIVALGLVCLSSSQNLPNVEEAWAKLNEVVSKNGAIDIPQLNLSQLSLAGLNVSQLPIADGENALRKKCEKNGGPTAYDEAKKAGTQVIECVKGLVDFNQVKKEMDAAPTGDLDEVFKKYCLRKPIFKSCMVNFTNSIVPCLDAQERENQKIVHNITEKILNFVCYKEGDRIALFVAAKGPECFQSKAEGLMSCANSTFISAGGDPKLLNPATGLSALPKINDIPSLVFDQKSCRNMNTLQTCVVKVLEECEDPTPANLLDSIFNFIKKVTPCEKLLAS